MSTFERWLRPVLLMVMLASCSRVKDASVQRGIADRVDSARAVTATDTTAMAKQTPWIGIQYKTLPDSLVDYGGDTIVVADTVFGVRHVASRGHNILWLARSTGTGARGTGQWSVLASIDVQMTDEQRLFFHDCRLNKKSDRRIIALGEWDDLPWFTRIRRAWRPNVAARAFDEISIAGVDCKNTDHGE